MRKADSGFGDRRWRGVDFVQYWSTHTLYPIRSLRMEYWRRLFGFLATPCRVLRMFNNSPIALQPAHLSSYTRDSDVMFNANCQLNSIDTQVPKAQRKSPPTSLGLPYRVLSTNFFFSVHNTLHDWLRILQEHMRLW